MSQDPCKMTDYLSLPLQQVCRAANIFIQIAGMTEYIDSMIPIYMKLSLQSVWWTKMYIAIARCSGGIQKWILMEFRSEFSQNSEVNSHRIQKWIHSFHPPIIFHRYLSLGEAGTLLFMLFEIVNIVDDTHLFWGTGNSPWPGVLLWNVPEVVALPVR